ncbi:PTS sugar transporter subunit IIA [Anaerostipes sp.]|uniref:PTS sugar transporter subunit IIA n=1 Tax=Anaerostipes sp. TaxID=1872530 RepID=UPI0025BF3036|nr:PTS sugar transporter subunit IIA [Anaerostipes sp.]MBS7007819.1 PTS sugar transporter subunit IIA [Anaerostipes sp.]
MVWERLNKELILPQIDAEDSGSIFEEAGGKLISLGYCKDSYVEALKQREKDFPTGVDMGGAGVAIPHTDVSHVLKKGIAIVTTKKPVSFVQMGTDDETVDVRVIFMLAVDEKGHLELLQAILGILRDLDVIDKLSNAQDPEEIINIIKEKENSL